MLFNLIPIKKESNFPREFIATFTIPRKRECNSGTARTVENNHTSVRAR